MATQFNGFGGFDSDFFAAYKHVYNPKRVAVLAYKNRPYFEQLTKKDMFEGDTYNHTVFFEDPQGGSASIATAIQQKAGHSQGARFVINRGREYQAITLQNEAIRASRSDNGSLLRKKTHETDRILNEMCRRIDIALHGSGTGVIASFSTASGSPSGKTITLDTPALGIRFSVGMFLQISSTNPLDGTAPTLVNGGQVVKVLNRSVSAKQTTLVLDTDLGAITGLTGSNQYFLLRNGEGLGFGMNTPYGGVSGLKNWLPITAPVPGESFWGFDRSIDTQRLAGSRYVAATGEKMEATFQNSSAEIALQGGNPNLILMNPINISNYSQELGAKVRYMESDNATTGLKTAMIVRGQSGDMYVLSDPQVDPGRFYMLQSDTWWMPTLDAVPHMDEAAGLSALREATSDGIELRWRAWYNLVCDAPGLNLTGSFGY